MRSTSILFVCTGNICRSPMAEAMFRHKVRHIGEDARYLIDSAGTHGYHVGERPDLRTIKLCEKNRISTEGIAARKIIQDDFEKFDLILGLDRGHVEQLQAMTISPQHLQKIALLMEYALGQGRDVPDPYYGSITDFEDVYKMLDHALNALIEKERG